MRAGLLDQRATFSRYTYQTDKYGHRTRVLAPIFGYENVYVNVRFVGSPSAGASEEVVDDQVVGKVKIEVMSRYISGIKFDDVIIYNNCEFQIYSIQTIGRKEGMKIRAELRDDMDFVAL